jgi:hypothetical protein
MDTVADVDAKHEVNAGQHEERLFDMSGGALRVINENEED